MGAETMYGYLIAWILFVGVVGVAFHKDDNTFGSTKRGHAYIPMMDGSMGHTASPFLWVQPFEENWRAIHVFFGSRCFRRVPQLIFHNSFNGNTLLLPNA